MARSDLLIPLVKAKFGGDGTKVRLIVEKIIAYERSKQHNVLAERLCGKTRGCNIDNLRYNPTAL